MCLFVGWLAAVTPQPPRHHRHTQYCLGGHWGLGGPCAGRLRVQRLGHRICPAWNDLCDHGLPEPQPPLLLGGRTVAHVTDGHIHQSGYIRYVALGRRWGDWGLMRLRWLRAWLDPGTQEMPYTWSLHVLCSVLAHIQGGPYLKAQLAPVVQGDLWVLRSPKEKSLSRTCSWKLRKGCDWPVWVMCPSWLLQSLWPKHLALSLARSVHMTLWKLRED